LKEVFVRGEGESPIGFGFFFCLTCGFEEAENVTASFNEGGIGFDAFK
jgi:hypothetical protein